MPAPKADTPRRSSIESKTRFLDAADRVFLEYGYDRATIRRITAEAKTSLARLNRHWEGKEQLFQDVFARHFNPIHNAQHEKLDDLVKQGRADDPRAILEAFLLPALTNVKQNRLSHQIYCRALIDPAEEAKRIVTGLARQLNPRVINMLRDALPAMDAEIFFFIVTTVMGAYVHPQTRGPVISANLGVEYGEIDWERGGKIITDLLIDGISGAKSLPRQDKK